MRNKILSFILLLIPAFCNAQDIDSILKALDSKLKEKNIYHQDKVNRIDSIKQLKSTKQDKSSPLFESQKLLLLFDEYKTFLYDSAFTYATKYLHEVSETRNSNLAAHAKYKIGYALFSAGMFSEALDTLVHNSRLSRVDSIRFNYCRLIGQTYFEMADYTEDLFYTPIYETIGQAYLDSALQYCIPNSKKYYSVLGLKNLRKQNVKEALGIYQHLLNTYTLSNHEIAIITSSMAYLFNLKGQSDRAIYMLAQAAIADIKNATKETVALKNLAEELYNKGEIERAYRYINYALDDAFFYEARHRKSKISDILPIIEKERLRIAELQTRKIFRYASLITGLVLVVLVLIIVVLNQLRKLKQTRNLLSKSNSELQQTNRRLYEANRIKEEYIGHSFKIYSNYIDRFEKTKTTINRKLVTNSYQDIKDYIRNIDLKKERDAFYADFDSSFLKIFPNFIEKLNELFKEEDQFEHEPQNGLSHEIRIFALIRLGIKDNEKIAQVLNLSLNTIYTYKTKIKNKSLVSNEVFEEKIMEIKAV
jgi:hypothetical protein